MPNDDGASHRPARTARTYRHAVSDATRLCDARSNRTNADHRSRSGLHGSVAANRVESETLETRGRSRRDIGSGSWVKPSGDGQPSHAAEPAGGTIGGVAQMPDSECAAAPRQDGSIVFDGHKIRVDARGTRP